MSLNADKIKKSFFSVSFKWQLLFSIKKSLHWARPAHAQFLLT